ncbi:MAG: hypothetical protein QM692_09270 [Thermomicrobiales bacterium]
MDASQFDAATQRLTGLLTRRRGLGLVAALGVSAMLATSEADAKRKKKKKKHKKKPQPVCTCPACSTCVGGVCQPVADGVTCGADSFCLNQVCARSCTEDLNAGGSDCPAGSVCAGTLIPQEPDFCSTDADAVCPNPDCTSTASCAAGQACVSVFCDGGALVKRCVTIRPS